MCVCGVVMHSGSKSRVRVIFVGFSGSQNWPKNGPYKAYMGRGAHLQLILGVLKGGKNFFLAIFIWTFLGFYIILMLFFETFIYLTYVPVGLSGFKSRVSLSRVRVPKKSGLPAGFSGFGYPSASLIRGLLRYRVRHFICLPYFLGLRAYLVGLGPHLVRHKPKASQPKSPSLQKQPQKWTTMSAKWHHNFIRRFINEFVL